jgi:uncharacterized protein (DUF302 family)
VTRLTVTRHEITVQHITIESPKPFEETKAALEKSVPNVNPEFAELARKGETARLREVLERGSELAIFLARDHGALLQMTGHPRKAVQYEIGNPLTASQMTQHQLPAGLYAPLRVILYEEERGGSRFEYDLPSSLFGQFGDDRVTAVGRGLDEKLERALRRAAE